MNEQDYIDYLELINEGHSQRSAAKILGIDRSKIQRYIKKQIEKYELENIEETVLGVQNQNDYTDWQSKPKPELANAFKGMTDSFSKLAKSLSSYKQTDHGNEFDEKKPKILFYDIETTLAKSYHFGQWKQNLSVKQQVQEGHLLSHAWAWGDEPVVGSILTREEVLNHDPERLVLEAWSLLDNADIVVAHYGKKFDIPKLNGYFLKYGLNPPTPYKVVDTKEISSKKFLLPFNSLEYLAKALGVQQKIDNSGIQLWIDCDNGKQEALDEMLAYNIGDIEALRDVYYRLITWDNNGVNMALYNDHGAACTHCGSDDVVSIEGKYAYTVVRKYALYRCNSCQAILRSNRKEDNSNKLVRVVQ